MILVPLILGLGAIYVLVYGSVRHSDLPPIDALGSMQPYEEPRRPAPVAKQADTTPVSVRPQPTSRPRQPRPIPQKDHYNDDAWKKFTAWVPEDSERILSKSTGKLQEFRITAHSPWRKSPNLKGPQTCTVNGETLTGSDCQDMDGVMDYFHDQKPNQPGFETTIV